MATVTSTIKLVDQMTPTLNKISKAIDRIQNQANRLGGTSSWGGFTTGVTRATKSTHNLYNALRRTLFLVGTLKGLSGLTQVADTMMNATARINNINDGLYTTSQYLDIIYGSAQRSRGSFSSMAASIGKLGTVAGDAFGSVNEMIAFTELMNKLFVLSGSSAAEASNAMYQLTQAMAAGRLQGDEMRSILENAPLLAQKIADHLGVTKGEIKKLGADGVITADIIKNALFGAAEEIEEKFSNMPKTIGQIWNEIKNHALNSFRPVIERVQKFINSPMFEKFKNKIFSIITAISNAIIRLFDAFESPRFQNAISRICAALKVLWDVALSVGNFMVKVATWICDNWSWIGQIVYAVIAAVLLYKAVVLAVSAAVCIAEIAKGVAAWVGALMAGNAWAWVILIIVALIAVIYGGVAAWNYFTDSTVSATGVLLGCIAFVIACVWDLIVAIWDVCVTIVQFFVFVGKIIVQVGINIWDTFVWLGTVIAIWGSNIASGMSQLCEQLPSCWDYFKYSVVSKFWSIVASAGNAFNSLVQGARDVAVKMLSPFEGFANGVISLLNSIIRGWNSLCGKLTFTVPSNAATDFLGISGHTVGLNGATISELSSVSASNWIGSAGSIDMSDASSKSLDAAFAANTALKNIGNINWSSTDIPSYSDSVNWDLSGIWNDFTSSLGETWNGNSYKNPIESFKNWYEKGATIEEGFNGLVDGIGAIIEALFGGGSTSTSKLPDFSGEFSGGNVELPSSLEDLLGGYGGGGGLGDKLGSIADNTGKTAGSTSDIDDKLDLAEEELELLRKLAEQEIINRFTTAEIHVDMTNNNNVSSNMDLDGIVTHLSNKLYEELGVVASGVHY